MFKKLIVTLLFLSASMAQARTFVGGGTSRSSGGKENTRWTLADWITQKQSFATMDHWLALNKTLDLFEVNVEGGKSKYNLTASGNVSQKVINHLGVSAYWSIFGLEYQRDESDEKYKQESGQLNIRFFGTNSQASNLTGFYGARKTTYENPANEYTNNFYGGKLDLYIVNFFGLEGQYKKYMTAKDSNSASVGSERVEYGAFIDVYFVRVYGQAFSETTDSTSTANVLTREKREGNEVGVKFYF